MHWIAHEATPLHVTGPIETGIWGKSIDKPGGAATPRVVSSLYDSYLERALAMSRREITKPGFFLPASRVGEKVWKVCVACQISTVQ